MTDHANELRRYSRKIGHPAGNVPSVMLAAADEIEQLRAELSEQCRLLGMSAEREAKHLAQIAALEKERDALKAWKEEVEKQEPKAWMLECQTLGGDTGWILSWTQSGAGLCDRLKGEEHEKRLYALPGAQGEEK